LWIGVGHLGADPEIRYTPASRPVCNFSVATTEVWKDKSGTKQEKTEWHRICVWGDLAENCSKYLSKGRSVYLEGKLETRSYDKEGRKHYSTQIVAHKVVFLGGGKGERAAGEGEEGPRDSGRQDGGGQKREPAAPPGNDTDIPFIVLE